MMGSVKFGIFADLHVDIMHDGEERLRVFLNAARREQVDFVIQLGDFCYPDENRRNDCPPEYRPVNVKNALLFKTYSDKDEIRRMYRDFEKPSYHVIGNHDCDMCSKEQLLTYHSMKKAYYSFDVGEYHFIVLDTNYFMENGEYHSYEYGNYFDESGDKVRTLPYLPPFEIEWLKKDLDSTEKPSVIFSHQSLRKGAMRSILNSDAFKEAISNRRSKVVLCFNGHTHLDGVALEDGIYYMHLNSMSNHWMGEEFSCFGRYGRDIDEKYPNIKYVAPYSDPLFAIVELDGGGAKITGKRANIVGKTPDELDYYKSGRGLTLINTGEPRVSAAIEDIYLSFDN